MSINIQRFQIKGLHQSKNYDIPIKHNTIVMVGVNGLGKTTVVNLLYLILSRQWDRVLDYNFESIQVMINDATYTLQPEKTPDNTKEIAKRLRNLIRRHTSPSTEVYNLEQLAAIAQQGGREALALELDRRLPISSSVCRRIAAEIELDPRAFNKNMLSPLDALLAEHAGQYQVLYLPTYRRIEKELASIFPDLEDSVHTFQRRRGVLQDDPRRGYIELVEFGMEDVVATFGRTRRELIETTKSELSNLAGGYLRDVIRGEGEHYELATFKSLDTATIDRILNRAEEQTLSETDKRRLKAVIEQIKVTPSDEVAPADRYIAHFFSKLVNVDKALSAKEILMHNFNNVCNKYLADKHVVYDDKNLNIDIRLDQAGKPGKPLELKSLSSGEKQIVSLFSQLYLREKGDVFVIIDEPELSLSVRWQQQLLPDIMETGRCKFLAAVTHSPFIFDNSLDVFALDLAGCITEVGNESR